MAEGEKRGRGRPRKKRPSVPVKFDLDAEQADFLLDFGARLGWGETLNAIAQRLVQTEVGTAQKASFLAHPWPFQEPRER